MNCALPCAPALITVVMM